MTTRTPTGNRLPDTRGLLVVGAAIALLVLAALIAVWMLGGRGGEVGLPSVEPSPTSVADTTEPSSSPTPAESSTPEPTEVPTPTPKPSGPATVAWSQGEIQEGRVSAVVRRGDSWVAGGSLQIGDFTRAVVWTSPDGLAWSEAVALPPEPVPDADGLHPRYWINGFGEWDGALLAFGWNGVGCCDGGYPMLWRSDDGESWSVVDTAGSAYGDAYHFPQRSVITPAGELAVLSVTGLGSGASVFVTGDLATWEEHPITSSDLQIQVSGLAASPGLVVLMGTENQPYEAGEDPPTRPHAWVSADGRTWTPLVPPNPEGRLDSVTWDPVRERFVAVGSDDDGAPAAWLTADGGQWSRIPLADEPGQMQDVVAVYGLVVASGRVGPLFEASGETIAWTSHDGVTWRVVPLVDSQRNSVAGATPGSAVTIVDLSDGVSPETWQSWAGAVDE